MRIQRGLHCMHSTCPRSRAPIPPPPAQPNHRSHRRHWAVRKPRRTRCWALVAEGWRKSAHYGSHRCIHRGDRLRNDTMCGYYLRQRHGENSDAQQTLAGPLPSHVLRGLRLRGRTERRRRQTDPQGAKEKEEGVRVQQVRERGSRFLRRVGKYQNGKTHLGPLLPTSGRSEEVHREGDGEAFLLFFAQKLYVCVPSMCRKILFDLTDQKQ